MGTDSPLTVMRKARELTQQQVAERWCAAFPEDPKTAKYIACWENGTRAASVPVLQKLAGIYDCTMAELLGEVPLAVALAVVTQGRQVLLVHNRDSDRWQFPAGTVKPSKDPERTAMRECRAETGTHVQVRSKLGQRVHPRTRALCLYFACDYLAGDVVNGDPDENTEVSWVPIAALGEFIPVGDLFEPVAKHLGVRTGCLQSA